MADFKLDPSALSAER